jgi:hypothetical protein
MDRFYRVEFRERDNPPHTFVEVFTVYTGVDKLDTQPRSIYFNVHDLPMWMQRKVAVLMGIILDPITPSVDLHGVGRKISDKIFWLYPDDEKDRE